MTSTFTTTNTANLNTVSHGDCVEIMRHMQPDGHSRPVPTEMAGGKVGESYAFVAIMTIMKLPN
jgi:hypothetical protein